MKNVIYCFLAVLINISSKIIYKTKDYILKKELMSCGNNVTIGRNCTISAKRVSIGNDVYIGDGAIISSAVSNIYIGNKVMFGPNVEIHSGNHRFDLIGRYMIDITLEDKRPTDDLDVIIEDDVWIGAKCIILNGVRVGEGSIIGAGTVLTKDIPPYSIVTGSKSYTVRKRFSSDNIIEHKSHLG